MALNMRIMTKELEIAKYEIEKFEKFDNISFDFKKIHNQKATDSTFYTESFKANVRSLFTKLSKISTTFQTLGKLQQHNK